MSQLKKIAIVGASGRVGKPFVDALLESGKFDVTAISRLESSATFPAGVNVQKGDYTSQDFLTTALKGQDVLVMDLSVFAPKDLQHRFIEAAAVAGVPWILLCEFGADNGHPEMSKVGVNAAKKQFRDKVESLGKSSWIGFISGLWFDYSLANGAFGINIKERTARFYDDGLTTLSTSTLPQVGRGLAKLFELPISTLEKYKNQFVYIHSFHVSQMDMLKAVQRATKTSDADWKISRVNVDEAIKTGGEQFQSGNYRGLVDMLYGTNFKPGNGGLYEDKSDNKSLGLADEDLDTVVKRVVAEVEAGTAEPLF